MSNIKSSLIELLRSHREKEGTYMSQSVIRSRLGVTDSEADRPKVWGISQALAEMEGDNRISVAGWNRDTAKPDERLYLYNGV